MERRAHQIDVKPEEVLNIFLRQLRVATSSLRHTHAAIQRLPAESLPMLDVEEGLALMVEDPNVLVTPIDGLRETESWLLRAAFIDLITGLNRSLIEGCRIIRIYKRAKDDLTFESQEDMETYFLKMDAELMKRSIPAMIQELQDQLEHPLPLKDEISSVNQLRNCLVHGNGIVGRQHLNQKAESVFRLLFIQQDVFVKMGGVPLKVNRALKDQEPIINGLKTEHQNITMDFKLGDTLLLSTDLYNNVAFTCYLFLHALRNAVYELLGVKPNHIHPAIRLNRAAPERP